MKTVTSLNLNDVELAIYEALELAGKHYDIEELDYIGDVIFSRIGDLREEKSLDINIDNLKNLIK